MNEMGDKMSMASRLQALLAAGTVSATPASEVDSHPLRPPHEPPTCVVRPANADELQAILHCANQEGLNLTVTSSSGPHYRGGIAGQGEHVRIDLSHWRRIDLIDRRNRVCRIEPGVTYGELLAALAGRGLTVPMPLAPRSGKSVLASVMDREPTTWPNKQWDGSDPVASTEFFFGSGERFRTGAAGGPGSIEQQRESGGALKFSSGPSQTDFHRVVQGAQGTMGIVTWITVRTELRPSVQKTLLAGADRLEELIPLVYAVQRGMLGEETFILDRTAAAMLMVGGAGAYATLRAALPAFICLQNVAGFERLAEERLAYQLHDIGDLAQGCGLRLEPGLGPLSGADVLARALEPCGRLDWRCNRHGQCLSVFFLSTLDRMPALRQSFVATAAEEGIAEEQTGCYIQPVVQNHACHMELLVPYDPDDHGQVERMRRLERRAVVRLLEAGAFFSRPYGSAAELVWARDPASYQLLKTIKGLFDPNRVLQRGKWDL